MILLVFLLIFAHSCFCDSNNWRGIVPLESTRVDVEKLLGPPTIKSKVRFADSYRTETEFVSISYVDGPCEVTGSGKRIVDQTVLEINVRPTVELLFKDLKIDRSRFSGARDPGSANLTDYTNVEDGISIAVYDTGEIYSLRFFAPSKFRNLKCNKQ